jgi:hypothetical protein
LTIDWKNRLDDLLSLEAVPVQEDGAFTVFHQTEKGSFENRKSQGICFRLRMAGIPLLLSRHLVYNVSPA